jgi:hypothetical protein
MVKDLRTSPVMTAGLVVAIGVACTTALFVWAVGDEPRAFTVGLVVSELAVIAGATRLGWLARGVLRDRDQWARALHTAQLSLTGARRALERASTLMELERLLDDAGSTTSARVEFDPRYRSDDDVLASEEIRTIERLIGAVLLNEPGVSGLSHRVQVRASEEVYYVTFRSGEADQRLTVKVREADDSGERSFKLLAVTATQGRHGLRQTRLGS